MMNLENKRQIAILVLAIGSGLIAATLVGNYIQRQIEKERKVIIDSTKKQLDPLQQQYQAIIGRMQQLEQQQVTLAQQAAQAALTPAAAATVAAEAVPKSSLSLRTPSGKRAYTILIDSLSAVGGMINPGDYVDILADMNVPNPTTGQNENITTMVYQNIQILAVGTNLQQPGSYEAQQNSRALNITFALTPQESGLMTFLQKSGKLQLILRAPAETEIQPMDISAWSTLADYVYEKQGTELLTKPKQREERQQEEIKPFIQIFQSGKQL